MPQKRATQSDVERYLALIEHYLSHSVPTNHILSILKELEGIEVRQAYHYIRRARENITELGQGELSERIGLIVKRLDYLLQNAFVEKNEEKILKITTIQMKLLSIQKNIIGKPNATTLPTRPQALPRELERLLEELGTDRLGEGP